MSAETRPATERAPSAALLFITIAALFVRSVCLIVSDHVRSAETETPPHREPSAAR
jgi:hypothetical protein